MILFLISNMFPWDLFQNLLEIIQFPWRLYTYVSIFIALSVGFLIKNSGCNRKCILIIFVTVMISFVCYSAGYYRMMFYESFNEKELV